MLRLPPFRYHRPDTVSDAVDLLAGHGPDALPISGGTDLIPNMKHGLFTPRELVSLRGIPALKGVRIEDGDLVVGAGETLASVSSHILVRQHFPALGVAAGHVAGPQLRTMGTLGGNLALDTRCTYYNQTGFWREALGYCLKKEGTVCHVTRVGKKCVAAHSADTPPVLMVLDARVRLQGPSGVRQVPVRDFFVADGIQNTRREPNELITAVYIPLPDNTFRAVYRKLRQRKSIDYPLLTVVVGGHLDPDGVVGGLSGVVTALGSRPRELSGWDDLATGEHLTDDLVDALADRAFAQCHPLENITVDTEWRRAMVRVQVRRALVELREGVRA